MTTFLLLHGYGGTHPEHWQGYLENHLKEKNQKVLFPILPNYNEPKLDEWMTSLEKELKDIDTNTLVIAAHSLGCSLWLHYISKNPNIKPKKVFLVSPPLNDCGIIEITTFFPLPDLDLSNQNTQVIGSDNDNFILEKEFETLAENLEVPLKIIPGAGHINAPIHGDWRWMNEECLKLISDS
ncbi:alpha/beta hydrolase [Candidatus Pacearchaeota archaeon]|nr:alpha/beta hydrolase [Candidatus Pacearchaeota archaeon]